MGLKQDLINAKIEGLKLSGANEEAIEQAEETLEAQIQLEVDAIVNFLTRCNFRVTQLKANVVLEDFKIPPRTADILPQVTSRDIPYPAGTPGPPVQFPLQGGKNGIQIKNIDIGKRSGGLQSTGYVFIGGDPDSQEQFDVSNKDGQQDHTTVKLFKDDIEDLL